MAEWQTTRRYVRLDTPGTALLCAGERAVPYAVKNVSAGGVLLAGDAPLAVGRSFDLEMQLHEIRELVTSASDRHDGSLRLTAHVNRVAGREGNHFEVALEFDSASQEAGALIEELTWSRLSQDIIGQRSEVLLLTSTDDEHLHEAVDCDVGLLGHYTFGVTTMLEAVFWLQMPQTYCRLALIDCRSKHAADLLDFLCNRYPSVHRVLIADDLQRRGAELLVQTGVADAVLGRRWTLWELAAAL